LPPQATRMAVASRTIGKVDCREITDVRCVRRKPRID
jgi:hypothetical protein